MRRLLVTCLAATLLAGCGIDDTGDPLQATDKLVAATPAPAPPQHARPAGNVIPTPATELSAHDQRTNTVALADNDGVTLVNPATQQRRHIPLHSKPNGMHAENGHVLAALPKSDHVVDITIDTGETDSTTVRGGPTDAIRLADGALAVAQRDAGTVTILRGNHRVTAEDFEGPARLFNQGGNLQVLDRLSTSLTEVDPETGDKETSLRAGQGATNGTGDNYDRVLTVDARKNEFLAFDTNPLILKQRQPLPGSPYDIAYDPNRDLAWISLPDRNEVIAFDVAGGQPELRHRFPTVAQPNTVSVNPDTGEVYIASAQGTGLQVVKP